MSILYLLAHYGLVLLVDDVCVINEAYIPISPGTEQKITAGDKDSARLFLAILTNDSLHETLSIFLVFMVIRKAIMKNCLDTVWPKLNVLISFWATCSAVTTHREVLRVTSFESGILPSRSVT